MASEATITPELILKAINEVAASGKRPTLELVRDLLATWTGTKGGSFTTLAPALRTWKENQQGATTEPIREAVPPVIAEKLAAWASDMWALSAETANARLNSEREAMNKVRLESEAEVAEVLGLADRLRDERDQSSTELAEMSELLAQVREEYSTFETDAVSRESSLSATVAQMQKQIDSQQAELERVHIDHEAVRKVQAAAIARLEVEHGRQLSAHATEVTRLEEQLKEQKQRSVAAIGKIEEAKQRQDAELIETRKEAKDVAIKLGASIGECEALRAQILSQNALLKDFTTQLGAKSTNGQTKK